MSRSPSTLRRGLLGLAFLGTMGFGVTQALASPRSTTAARLCSPENEAYCMDYCWKRGADAGACSAGGGGCRCYYY